MNITVSGAEGFIGRHLCRELKDHGHEVWGFDLRHGDLCDSDVAHKLVQDSELCIHLAAHVGRLFGEEDGFRTVLDNAGMTTNVARACASAGIPLCYVSTSEVYGDGGTHAWAEDEIYDSNPVNLYGLTKLWGEDVCRLYAPEGLTILRLSMPYGPGHPPGYGRAAITNCLFNALNRQPMEIHRGAERSWCFVSDTVRAMRMVIESGKGGAWNIGRDDDPWPMEAVAKLATTLADAPRGLVKMVNPPAYGQILVKRLSMQKLRRLGFEPHVELVEGMQRTLDWLREWEQVAA